MVIVACIPLVANQMVAPIALHVNEPVLAFSTYTNTRAQADTMINIPVKMLVLPYISHTITWEPKQESWKND